MQTQLDFYVSVGSWQGSHFWLVQAGLLGLISQLAHHHFCCSPLAKANKKASQGPRDGEENSTSRREKLQVTLPRAGVRDGRRIGDDFYDRLATIPFSDYEGQC